MKLIIFMVFLLVLSSMVLAFDTSPKPGDYCNYTQSATDFRNATNYTGIYGRFSNGSIDCFMPGNSNRAVVVNDFSGVGVPEFSLVTLIVAIISVGLGIAYFRRY